MRTLRSLGLMLVVLIALVFPLGPAAAQGGDPCIDAGGTIDPATGQCTIQAGVTLEIAYPVEIMNGGGLGFAAQHFLTDLQADFVQDFATYGLGAPSPAPWSLNVTYTVHNHPGFASGIVFAIYEYTGGANGNGRWQTFLYREADSTPLSLADLFAPGSNPYATLASVVPGLLQATYGASLDMDWVMDGTGEDPFNYQHFALTPTSLIFYFDEYQVGPGALGPAQVEVPLADISGILIPELRP